MCSTNKSYNEIVATCKLVDYREELAGKFTLFVEYWQDALYSYRCLFSPTPSNLPLTLFRTPLNET